MGLNPAFMIIALETRVHDVFAALAASADSTARSRLALHLPWSPARVWEATREPRLENESVRVGLGVRGWHGYARDVQNDHSFSVSVRGVAVPCDLSVYVGRTYALFEIRASTREAARCFSDESTRSKSPLLAGFEGCVEGIWYDNEHDPWRVVSPRDHVPKIACSRADTEEHMFWTRDPPMEIVDIDALGTLLVWLITPEV